MQGRSGGLGFALWIDGDVAWAKGTHEYRPMGAAVIGVEGTFVARDFSPRRRAPSSYAPSFEGLYASLGEMNDRLRHGRSQLARRGSRREVKGTAAIS
jgi:hypothetical protein